MQQPEPQPITFSRLNVWGVTLSGALTALIILILSLPFHLMHQRSMGEPRGFSPGAAAQHPMMGGEGIVAFVLIALLLALVYGGVAGAIFASIYNAILNRR